MLCFGRTIFVNGESRQVGKESYRILRKLADSRQLAPAIKLTKEAQDLLYEFYLDGYVELI